MADKNEYIEIKFETSELQKGLQKTEAEIEKLSAQQKVLKKSTLDLAVEIEKKQKAMKQAEKTNQTNTASYVKLYQEVTQLKQAHALTTKERKQQLSEINANLKLAKVVNCFQNFVSFLFNTIFFVVL